MRQSANCDDDNAQSDAEKMLENIFTITTNRNSGVWALTAPTIAANVTNDEAQTYFHRMLYGQWRHA